jgi:hypothetical protein
MRRIPMILVFLAALLIAGGCGQYGKQYKAADKAATASGREAVVTKAKFDDAARKEAGCGELEEFKSEGQGHTTDPSEKVDYKHNPPHSGQHYQVPLDWGLYDTEQRDVEWVHNLEHGHIVMLYRGLTSKQRNQLLDDARINPYHLLVIPRKKNPKPGVYYMAWAHQIYCERPSKAALQYMITNYRDQGPELFTTDAAKSGTP